MLYKGVKYACSTCIKGHRSSQCTHAERPLFEIRKKGRPVTQCSLCRDLRKTKQVHIKCACTHKSTKDKASIVVPDTRDNCNCSDSNHDHHLPTTTAQDDSAGYAAHHVNMTASDEAYLSLLSSTQQPSMIDTTWALTTATEETFVNDDNADLGFLFHKPSSRRFLDGQPRPPRKKSGKKQQTATFSYQQQPSTLASSSVAMMQTSTVENTSQKHIMLPFMNMDLSSSTSSTTSSSSSSCADGDPLSTDVTTMLNNVLMQQAEDQDLAEAIYNDRDFTEWMDTLSHLPQQPSAPASDYCSMYPGQTECRSKHNATGPGESVLITITPLPSITSSTVQAKVRTRLATCYCASHCCTCPGCLVHPFAGLTESHVGSTATSSVYSNSDDEDHQHPPLILLG